METIEINIKEYINLIKRKLWWIIGLTILSMFITAFILVIRPEIYKAECGIIITKVFSKITFEPKFQILKDDQINQYNLENETQRRTLVKLVENPEIEMKMLKKIMFDYKLTEKQAEKILKTLTTSISGNLINISFIDTNSSRVIDICNNWGNNYVEYINTLYNTEKENKFYKEMQNAEKKYKEIEQLYLEFVENNNIDVFLRLIEEKKNIIMSLEKSKNTAVATLINKDVEKKTEFVNDYIIAQTENKKIIFSEEQEAKRKLLIKYFDTEIENRLLSFEKDKEIKLATLSNYVDAKIQTKKTVFNEQLNAEIKNLSNYYIIKNRIEQLIRDTELLKKQIKEGSSSSGSVFANTLSAILLQTSVYTMFTDIPAEFKIDISTISNLKIKAEDIDKLLILLQEKKNKIEVDIKNQSQKLAGHSYYDFFASPTDNPLSNIIKEKYKELFEEGELTKLSSSITGESLFKTIEEKYKELFTQYEIFSLSEKNSDNNSLSKITKEKVNELFQFEGLDYIIKSSLTKTSLNIIIDKLQKEINSLQQALTKEIFKKEQLEETKKISWETYNILAKKTEEMNITSQFKDTIVVFAYKAIKPKIITTKLISIILIGMIMFMFTICCIIGTNVLKKIGFF